MEYAIIYPPCKQAMKSKQSALLIRLDALDEECTALKEELIQVESNREQLACDLQQVQVHYEEVQQQLNTERVGICHSGTSLGTRLFRLVMLLCV